MPLLRSGSAQSDLATFNSALFGLQNDYTIARESDSLLSTDYSATGVTVKDSIIWSTDAETPAGELIWVVGSSSANDKWALDITVDNGAITGTDLAKPLRPVSQQSGSIQVDTSDASGASYLAFAETGASPSELINPDPHASVDQSLLSFTLGNGASAVVEAVFALATAAPLFLIFTRRRTGPPTRESVAAMALGIVAALSAMELAYSAAIGVYVPWDPWLPTMLLPTALVFTALGTPRSPGSAPHLGNWVAAAVTLCYCLGAATVVLLGSNHCPTLVGRVSTGFGSGQKGVRAPRSARRCASLR